MHRPVGDEYPRKAAGHRGGDAGSVGAAQDEYYAVTAAADLVAAASVHQRHLFGLHARFLQIIIMILLP